MTELMRKPPRCGDSVHHRPTGETWIVSYADAERDLISWCGWPEGCAKLSDCDIHERVSDEEHARCVSEWLNHPHFHDNGREDERVGEVRRLYRQQETP